MAFERSMLDASPDCIKVISVEGELIAMNRTGCLALGVPEDSSFGMAWVPLLSASVHEAAYAALDKARDGMNARFAGRSDHGGRVRYWDSLLTPVRDTGGTVQVILCVSRDVTERTVMERELERAMKRQKLLAEELQHRIKNVFAVVAGLISLSQREAETAGVPDSLPELLRGKLSALARASEAVFSPAAIMRHDLDEVVVSEVVRAVLQPYEGRFTTNGVERSVSRQNMTTIVLFLHEMATNSMKHGALGNALGKVSVEWTPYADDAFGLVWREAGGPPVKRPEVEGFGTGMLDRMVQSVGGSIIRDWAVEGLVAELRLPNGPIAREVF
jgi:PAS domain S-box-containing protein